MFIFYISKHIEFLLKPIRPQGIIYKSFSTAIFFIIFTQGEFRKTTQDIHNLLCSVKSGLNGHFGDLL